MSRRVALEELIDPEVLAKAEGSRSVLRGALPRGWVLEEDGLHARRDARLLFREGWVLILGLVSFGAVALGMFWSTFPRGGAGVLRFVLLVVTILVLGGLVAPSITRALKRG